MRDKKIKVRLFKSQVSAIKFLLSLRDKKIDDSRVSYVIRGGFHRVYIFPEPIESK